MAIKVIAQRRVLKIGKNPGAKRFVMRPDLYIPIQEKKVFAEASTHSGISAGVIKAAWDAVENLEDVKTGLITTRRIVFTPSVEVKDELQNTSIQITCLDEEGNVLKRVTSGDSGDIEDPELENQNQGGENNGQGGSTSGDQGGNQGGGGGTDPEEDDQGKN